MAKKVLCFDIDGTLCGEVSGGNREEAEPFLEEIAEVNRLFNGGHRILLYTARGASREFTERQLKAWGVLYHELHTGKPGADVYIDDKAISAAVWARAFQTGQPIF